MKHKRNMTTKGAIEDSMYLISVKALLDNISYYKLKNTYAEDVIEDLIQELTNAVYEERNKYAGTKQG